jgi:transcriptional regulator with XRE-family HTH domain
MRPQELRDWLTEIDIPVTRVAEAFGVDRKTVDRWLAGSREIPPSIGTECRLLAGRVQLYQLRPVPEHADSVHWRASSYRGTLNVRAPNSRMARQFALLKYGRATRRGEGDQIAPHNPWMDSMLVEHVRLPALTATSSEGPLGIIDPPG